MFDFQKNDVLVTSQQEKTPSKDEVEGDLNKHVGYDYTNKNHLLGSHCFWMHVVKGIYLIK